jgi:putative ABC transport system ATP-binding protein
MEPTVFKYLFRHSMKQHIFLLLLTVVSFPFLYASLSLPKTIINEAIGGSDFPRSVFNVDFGQIEFLLLLCGAFLVLVLINGGFKFWINVYKGQLGERMLRRLRYELFSRVLRFPLPHFRRLSQGEIISMITAEVEPLGGFSGDAVALPAFQGGTLLTILVFMFVQDPILGFAAIALYPVQMVLIPKLQKQVNELAKQRIRTVRKLSEHIGETVTGMQEIHAHDTSELELAAFSARMNVIYSIRYRIFRRKFLIKFMNNFIANLTPFLFYSIGGYLVIAGDLTFGALVAVLAAYKDLSAPWKDLLRFYQVKEDARIKYGQLVEHFQPAGMLEEGLQRTEPDTLERLHGALIATNLGLEEDGGIKIVDGATFSLGMAERAAVVGESGAGRAALAQILARLLTPSAGAVKIGDRNIATLPEAVTGRLMALADQNPYLFSGSVRDNLLYGLKHRPLAPPTYDGEARDLRERFVTEAEATGNTVSDIDADWIDYEAAGISGPEDVTGRAIAVLRAVDLEEDVFAMGLLGSVDPVARPALAERILEARTTLRQRLRDADHSGLVEFFDRELYNTNLSVAENLLFGTPIGADFDLDRLGENAYVFSVLERSGLAGAFLDIGLKLASIMVDLFQDLPPDHEFFAQFSFVGAEQLHEFHHCCNRAAADGSDCLDATSRSMLMSLPFKLTPSRHRLGLIDADMQRRLLEARHLFAAELPENLRRSVAFFDREKYNPAASLQDNILFGRLVYGRPRSQQVVGKLIEDVVASLDLRETIVELGLDTPVGIAGSRLAMVQRQKLGVARCLMKRPDLLIVNDAITAVDPAGQETIMENLFREFEGRGLVWILSRAELARKFHRALVMEAGKIIEQGRVEDLNQPGKLLHKLVAAE